jgi:predicted tellurium resistance membrane protein TerC
MAFLLRIALILMAGWVLRFQPLQWLAGGYLLWLFFSHLFSRSQASSNATGELVNSDSTPFLRTVLALALTDLAFSIDSVAAAVAISDQLLLVICGALIGVIALRFTAGLFVRWLELYGPDSSWSGGPGMVHAGDRCCSGALGFLLSFSPFAGGALKRCLWN